MPTTRTTLVFLVALLRATTQAAAQKAASAPSPLPSASAASAPVAANEAIPPDADHAKNALAKSPRHGEWVNVTLPDGKNVVTWVVYPEKKEKAGVVIVIHEIFGMSDWVRGVTDQLAKEGFIALAPDFLSGMGPNGGGTESLGEDVGKVGVVGFC